MSRDLVFVLVSKGSDCELEHSLTIFASRRVLDSMPPSKTRPCSFTDQRAGFGVRREAGECNLTKHHYGEVVDGGRYTICEHCGACMCVECLEKIAENLEKFEQGGRTILPHEVWTALRSRCFVAGAVRVSGFRALRQGGGRWTLACPLCVKVDLMPPTPRVPKTLTGEPYFDMPPKLHKQWKGILRAPLVIENSVAGPVRSHSVEVLVYEQLVGNDEAQCFRRMPAIGQYAVFWQPPIPSPGTDDDGLNVRIIA